MDHPLHNADLIGEIGQSIFSNIEFDESIKSRCRSLQAYAICMLYERLQGEVLRFSCRDADSEQKVDDITAEILRAEIPSVTYIALNYGNTTLLETCKNKLQDSFEYQKKISTFLSQSCDIAVYVNHQLKQTVLVTTYPMTSTESLIMAVLPFLVPWVFGIDESHPVPLLTDLEKELKDSVCLPQDSGTVRSQFNAWVNKFLERVGYNDLKLKAMCSNFGKEIYKSRIDNMQNLIAAKESDIQTYEAYLHDCLVSLQEFKILLSGYLAKVDDHNGDEYFKFFRSLDNVQLRDVTNGHLKFSIYTDAYINDDDIDEMHSYISNEDGMIYDGIVNEEREDYGMLLRELFSDDPLIYLQMQVDLSINMNSAANSGNLISANIYTLRDGYVYNPHIMEYTCFGTGREVIDQYIMRGDIFNAINQCIANAGNLNPAETNIVAGFLSNKVYGTSNKCLRTCDGECLDYDEAIQWLKERREN